jgi:hypothetical protein
MTTVSSFVKENVVFITLAALIVSSISATFTGCTLYFNFLANANVTIAIGEVAQLNQKPFVGLIVTLRNSGAHQAVITRGTLTFDNLELKLIMQSVEPATWTYAEPPNNTPAKFAFFTPIVLGKDESAEATLWFEADTGGTRPFTDRQHTLTVRLFGSDGAEPVATQQFLITLNATDVSNIYSDALKRDTLPVNITYSVQ